MAQDQVNHPAHYGGKDNPLEVIKIIKHYKLGFQLGNVIKYILRAENKGALIQDLEKALFYLKDEIEERKKAEGVINKGSDTSDLPRNVTLTNAYPPSIMEKVTVNGIEIGVGDKLELRDGSIVGPVINTRPSQNSWVKTHPIAIDVANGITKVYNELGECYNDKYSIVKVIKADDSYKKSKTLVSNIAIIGEVLDIGDSIKLYSVPAHYYIHSIEVVDNESCKLGMRMTTAPFAHEELEFYFDGKCKAMSGNFDIVKIIKSKDNETKA